MLQNRPVEEAPLPATLYVVGEPPLGQSTPVTFPTLSSTSTPTPQKGLLDAATPLSVQPVTADQGLLAFVHAPSGVVDEPYVILTVFTATPDLSVQVRGYENLREFVCTGFPCKLPLEGSSTVRFTARRANGEESPEVIARVRVETIGGKFRVFVDSVSQFVIFTDTCSTIWKVKDATGAVWPRFPDTPFKLNTNKDLYLLAARLITSGIVDASACPNNGLTAGLDYATPCGVEQARDEIVAWQNQYDFTIWTTGLETGIPPRVLKTLIEYESQFWPGNERFFLNEYGLGQVNQLGIDVVLRQNPSYFQSICPSILSDCALPYESLDPVSQVRVRLAVLDSVDSVCPTCQYGVDLEKANRNIPLVAELLRENCRLVSYLNLGGGKPLPYEEMWKFTLATYHSGFSCVRDAVITTRKDSGVDDWESVSQNFKCKDAKPYVDGFFGSMLSFDLYQLDSNASSFVQVAPTFLPSPTPIPPPTAIPSLAQVRVRVYLDANKNGQPDDIEWLDDMTVQLLFRNGETRTGLTENGIVTFDMTGFPPGMDVIVSMPGLYREALITLPEEGVVQIDFVFETPEIPQELP